MIVCLNIERHKILVHLPNPQHADMLADLLEEDADYWRFGLRLSPVELSYPEAVELQNRLEAALTAVKRLKEAGKEGVEIQYYSPHDHPELQPEPRLCPECRSERPVDEQAHLQLQSLLGTEWESEFPETLSSSNGCAACNNTGYRGRILVSELLSMTNRMRHAIREQLDSIAIGKAARQDGFKPMIVDALSHLKEGAVSLEDITRSVPPVSR